jgi:proline iminopeptidase
MTFAGFIADLEGLREALEIEQLDLMGHSLGAWIAIFRERANRRLFQPQFTPITAENVLEFPDRIMRDFADHNPIGHFEHVLCPTLVVHGELDPIPEEFARLLVARIPDARYVRINGASHFAFLEDTGRFIEAVEPFLSEQL